ncbi:hypothetical protein V6N13_100070 [Hibiscus sabdariffa]|uniref:Uncharacterized protein n=2 Tax=Hibiscus sabdariffa TaxID=183260 RepID=A0ABR2NUC0_9ROSI
MVPLVNQKLEVIQLQFTMLFLNQNNSQNLPVTRRKEYPSQISNPEASTVFPFIQFFYNKDLAEEVNKSLTKGKSFFLLII